LEASLDIIKISCVARCVKPTHIYQHMTPALRGAFGYTLSRIFDKDNGKPGIYQTIFKNETKSAYSDEYVSGKPNPYVFESPIQSRTELDAGDTISFSLTLFGMACGYVPEVIFTIEQMLKGRIMNSERAFEISSVSNYFTRKPIYSDGVVFGNIGVTAKPWQWTNEMVVEQASRLSITFVEPVSIKENGKQADSITFLLLIRSILNRLRLLTSIYGGTFQIDRNIYEEKAILVKTIESKLCGASFITHSRTQMEKKTYHGLTGDITYEGSLNIFLPYIHVGSIMHVGSNTIIGMGQYSWTMMKC